MRKNLFLLLAVVGTVWPMWHFGNWFLSNTFELGAFISAAFRHDVSAGAWADLLTSSVVFWIFLFTEGRRLGMSQLWVYLLLNLCIGLSLALPLFLYFRENKLTEN